MKKRLLTLVCALALVLSLMIVSAAATETFFLGINDTLPVGSTQITPIQYNGWVYVPMGVFNSRVTGVNLGVYCGLTDNDQSLVFYNLSGRTLTFDLVNGTATSDSGTSPVPSSTVRRNGTYYAPAYAICQYFGLTYSFHSTEYGPLLRIKDSNAVLSESLFLSSTASLMRNRSGAGNNSSSNPPTTNPGTAPPPQQPAVPEEPVIPERGEPVPSFSLYLGVRAPSGVDLTGTLNALAGVNASAVVFFPANTLAENTAQLRQAVARGHKVGLIPQGETAQDQLNSVAEGSSQLARILRQETWFVLSSDQAFTQAGYLCWSPGLILSGNTKAATLYDNVVDYGSGRSSAGRVLLEGGGTSVNLSAVLNRLAEDGDAFRPPRETRY